MRRIGPTLLQGWHAGKSQHLMLLEACLRDNCYLSSAVRGARSVLMHTLHAHLSGQLDQDVHVERGTRL
jgi:hypothetical protein